MQRTSGPANDLNCTGSMAKKQKIDNTEWEQRLLKEGYKLIAGVDEVGRGALAGPVVAACVVLGRKFDVTGITDSKKLTPKQRVELNGHIISAAKAVGVGIVQPEDIDRLNILAATLEAMRVAFLKCLPKPEIVLVDGNRPFAAPITVVPIVGGDNLSASIAAASIVAKVVRDSIMECAARNIDGYGFAQHKGYGTAEHLRAIYSLGPSRIHRMTFSPICEMEQGVLFHREEVGFF
jgi:ribonuclease HII